MPLRIVSGDITRLRVDAIVNAANERLLAGGGVCGAIFRAAGAARLQAACDEIGHCDTGSAVATPAFDLPARYVIHAVGPVWQGGGRGERDLLAGCYTASLELAADLGCASIAFPLISAGIYGYPKREALDVACEAMRSFLATDAGVDMEVTLVLFDADAALVAGDAYADVAAYLDDAAGAYVRADVCSDALEPGVPCGAAPAFAQGDRFAPLGEAAEKGSLEDLLSNMDASFSQTLLAMIDERGMRDADVYRRANLSRQHFSKIRSNADYRPSKPTVLALAIALRLSVDECELLLGRAGFALSHADRRDVIVEYYLTRGEYDIHAINRTLYAFDQALLG